MWCVSFDNTSALSVCLQVMLKYPFEKPQGCSSEAWDTRNTVSVTSDAVLSMKCGASVSSHVLEWYLEYIYWGCMTRETRDLSLILRPSFFTTITTVQVWQGSWCVSCPDNCMLTIVNLWIISTGWWHGWPGNKKSHKRSEYLHQTACFCSKYENEQLCRSYKSTLQYESNFQSSSSYCYAQDG